MANAQERERAVASDNEDGRGRRSTPGIELLRDLEETDDSDDSDEPLRKHGGPRASVHVG